MSPEQILLFKMVSSGMEIKPGTLESLREAIAEKNIYFFDKDGELSGFVTWYFEGKSLVINNLCLFQSGINKLFELRKIFHEKYPDLVKVKWWDDKHERPYEVRLKGRTDGFLENEHNHRPVTSTKATSG